MVFPQPILQCVVEKPRYTAACEGVYKKLSTLCTRLSPDTLWKVLWIKWIARFCDRFLQRYPAEREWQPKLGSVVRRTHGGGHKGGHQSFHPCESRFLLFVSLAKIRERRLLRKGERQRIFSSAWTRVARHVSAYSQGQIHFCYIGGLLSAGCGITVPHDSLASCDRQGLRKINYTKR